MATNRAPKKIVRKAKAGADGGAAPLARALVRERDALRKLFDDKLDAWRKMRRDHAGAWDEQWELLGEILDQKLWRARYEDAKRFFAAQLPNDDPREISRNVLVAGAFRAEDIAQRGVSVLEELALYVKEKSGMTERPRGLDLDRVVVEVPDGGEIRKVKGSKVTLQQLQAARKRLGKKKPARADGPRAKHVRERLAKRKALARLQVDVTETHATFRQVPLEDLGALGEVLAKLAVPKAPS
jgi:hypothetical protein